MSFCFQVDSTLSCMWHNLKLISCRLSWGGRFQSMGEICDVNNIAVFIDQRRQTFPRVKLGYEPTCVVSLFADLVPRKPRWPGHDTVRIMFSSEWLNWMSSLFVAFIGRYLVWRNPQRCLPQRTFQEIQLIVATSPRLWCLFNLSFKKEKFGNTLKVRRKGKIDKDIKNEKAKLLFPQLLLPELFAKQPHKHSNCDAKQILHETNNRGDFSSSNVISDVLDKERRTTER